MDVATKSFQNADNYDNARKGYPLESAELLLSKLKDAVKPKQINGNNNTIQTRTLLELGAGTGQFTKVLCKVLEGTDFTLVASEPLDSMGIVFKKNFPDLELICCTGDNIPLPDCSVDSVVAANTLHYLANTKTFTEISRVLKPGGVLAFVCNYVDLQRAPWAQIMYDLSQKYYNRVGINLDFDQNGVRNDWQESVNSTNKFSRVYNDFTLHNDPITEEETLEMFMSYGAFNHCNDAEREDVRRKCVEVLAENFSRIGKTMTELPMKSNLYWMMKKEET